MLNRIIECCFEQSLTPKELKIPDFQVSTRYFFSEQEEKWNDLIDSKDYLYKESKREKQHKLKK